MDLMEHLFEQYKEALKPKDPKKPVSLIKCKNAVVRRHNDDFSDEGIVNSSIKGFVEWCQDYLSCNPPIAVVQLFNGLGMRLQDQTQVALTPQPKNVKPDYGISFAGRDNTPGVSDMDSEPVFGREPKKS